MKLTPSKTLFATHGVSRHVGLKVLAAAGLAPAQSAGGGGRTFHFWGEDADDCLRAHHACVDAAREAKAATGAAPGAATGFAKGKMGVIERQLTAIMGALLTRPPAKPPADVRLVAADVALLQALHADVQGQIATVQGQHATLADVRSLVLELTAQVASMQITFRDLCDEIANPLAGPTVERVMAAATANGHDDAWLRIAR